MQFDKNNPQVTPNQGPIEWVFCLVGKVAKLPVVSTPLPTRFITKFVTDPITGCWLWTGPLFAGTGYGSFNNGSRREHWRAHRFSWTIHNGPIPKGLHVLHRCDTPRCVNPDHLFLGTAKDNHQDKARKGRHWQQKKTHCPHGHAYTFENTYLDPQGYRHCRTCKGLPPARKEAPKEGSAVVPGSKAKQRPFKSVVASLLFLLAFSSPRKEILMDDACTSRQLSLNFNITEEHVPTEFVRNLPAQPDPEVPSISTLEPGALPPALDELAKKFRPFIDRVLTRLSEAEREEVNTHLQQDIRQAWITVSYAQRMSDAFVQASYAIYGKHPDQVWPAIVADRKARLGAEYFDWYTSDGLPRPDIPKIPPARDAEPNERLDALMHPDSKQSEVKKNA